MTIRGPRIFGDDARDAAFYEGVDLGAKRVQFAHSLTEPPAIERTVAPLAAALMRRHAEVALEPHAIALLSELTATAAAVRTAHNEPPLTEQDIEDFLPAALRFFNTYVGCANPG